MANLIDSSFFIRNINLINVSKTEIAERITSFIDKYEKECLLKVLGYPLYTLAIAGSWAVGRMKDIKDGSDWVDCYGVTQHWQGLVHDTNISLLANYIYFYIQEASAVQTTGVNSAVPKGQNSQVVSPAEKMCNAWSFFSKETYDLISFLWNKKDESGVRVYPEFTESQYTKTKSFSRPINSLGI